MLLACIMSVSFLFYARNTAGSVSASANRSSRAEFESLPAGNPQNGEQVFKSMGCSACHSLNLDTRGIGPSLSGIATRATTLKPNYSAEMYIYEAIVNPDVFVVSGFSRGIMPDNLKNRLSKQQLADLIAFLKTK
jgi:cytochrome c551/c552